MEAVRIHKYGKNIQPRLEEVSIPEIDENEVLVKIHAASVNPIDFKAAQGGIMRLFFNEKTPYTMGHDFAGEVVKIGKCVTVFRVGDAVYGMKLGAFSEYIAVTENQMATMPKHLSYEEAAALPMAGLTSYQALHDYMHLSQGQKVLIQAGSGGVGSFAIQLAKVYGAYVATTTSNKNREFVEKLGADKVIDYHQTHFDEALHDYDGVFDTLGGEELMKAFKIVKPHGTVVSINGIPDQRTASELGAPLWKKYLMTFAARKINKAAEEHRVYYRFIFTRDSRQELNKIRKMVEANKIHPEIDKIFDLADTKEALDYIHKGHARGKVVIKVTEPEF